MVPSISYELRLQCARGVAFDVTCDMEFVRAVYAECSVNILPLLPFFPSLTERSVSAVRGETTAAVRIWCGGLYTAMVP